MDYKKWFDHLYAVWFQKLYHYLLDNCKSAGYSELQTEIQECLQDAFIILWNKREQVYAHPKIGAWLYTVSIYCLKNKISVCRTRQKHIAFSVDQTVEADMEPFIQHINLQQTPTDTEFFDLRLEKIREILGDDSYALLVDYYDKKITLGEVALKHGLTKGAVKMRIHRIMKKLRSIF